MIDPFKYAQTKARGASSTSTKDDPTMDPGDSYFREPEEDRLFGSGTRKPQSFRSSFDKILEGLDEELRRVSEEMARESERRREELRREQQRQEEQRREEERRREQQRQEEQRRREEEARRRQQSGGYRSYHHSYGGYRAATASLEIDRHLKTLDLPAGTRDWTAIKKQYRKLAAKYHPDVNKSPEAEPRIKEINVAYEALEKLLAA